MTLKKEHYKIIDNIKFRDVILWSQIKHKNLKWVSTKKNKVIHLTWDLYYEGSDYYSFKMKNMNQLWNHDKITSYSIL